MSSELRKKTVEQYAEELDRLVDLPEDEKQDARYLYTMCQFLVHHPDEARACLKPVFPKVTHLSTTDARTLGRMFANTFEGASFPYIPFSENNSIPAEQVRTWVSETVYPAVALEQLIQQNRKIVMSAIWDVLHKSKGLAADLSAEAADLAWETWAWAAQNLKSLLAEEKAKASTRLYAVAWYFARTFKAEKLRAKARFMDVDPDGLSREPDGTLLIEPTTTVDGGGAIPVARLFHKKRKDQVVAPSIGSLLCVACQEVNAVLSEDENENVLLSCQHTRPRKT